MFSAQALAIVLNHLAGGAGGGGGGGVIIVGFIREGSYCYWV